MRNINISFDPRDVLDELSTEEILEYLSDTVVDPEEIFTTTQLSEWAEENGYTKEQ